MLSPSGFYGVAAGSMGDTQGLTPSDKLHITLGEGPLLPGWALAVDQRGPRKPCEHPLHEAQVKSLSRVRLFATPWTVAYEAPLSTGFSRQ